MSQKDQTIAPGTVIRADFFWKNAPKADGKARNCVVIGVQGRRAVICPITSLSKENQAACHQIDARTKRSVDRLGDDKDSWINLAEQNVIYLDGPRVHRNHEAPDGADRRIFGALPAAFAERLRTEAIQLKVKPAKKQIEEDWKNDLLHLRGRDAMATIRSAARTPPEQEAAREERVRAAAQRLYDRKQETARPKLTLGSQRRKEAALGE